MRGWSRKSISAISRAKKLSAHHDRANAARSKARTAVEHHFAEMKSSMGLFVRTIGIHRATAMIGLANIAFNMKRLVFR